MKRFLLFAVLMVAFAPLVFGETLSWDAVTTYTDGKSITDDSVVYDAWGNDTSIANGITGTSTAFTVDKGSVVNLKVRARLVRQGGVSDNSTLSYTSPLGLPGNPANLRVAP